MKASKILVSSYSYGTTVNGVIVDYAQYTNSHGQAPRGRGHWAFRLGTETSKEIFWAPEDTFNDAKKAAALEAKRQGYGVIYVAA